MMIPRQPRRTFAALAAVVAMSLLAAPAVRAQRVMEALDHGVVAVRQPKPADDAMATPPRARIATASLGTGDPAGPKPVQVVILGDSTVSNYPRDSKLRGWGQVIGDGFIPGTVIHNLAASGRSTRTFLSEGRLDKALRLKADFALIQFGHNDSHARGRPESTDAATDYKDNLRTYVDAFRQAGTQPILVTPMHRRTFREGKLTNELQPYADAMKQVAREKGVPLIDLHAASGALFGSLGEAAGADLNVSASDRTHFSEKGARAMAGLVRDGLRQACPELARALRDDRPGS